MTTDEKLVDEKVAAETLGLNVRTLQKWRVQGGGPLFVKISARCVRYRPCDLDAWIVARTVASTSQSLDL